MRTTRWIETSDRAFRSPTKHSGGENQQFKNSYDATNRKTHRPNGALQTPQILSRAGKHVPKEKAEISDPDYFGPVNKSRPEVPAEPKHWPKKNYQLIAPAKEGNVELSQHDRAGKIAAAFREVYAKTPRTVKTTGKTGKAKTAMLRAIAFSKARAAGAKV